MTEEEELRVVEEKLKLLPPEITWDRFSGSPGSWAVFGWVDRPTDSYKDFVAVGVQWYQGKPFVWFLTSSARLSATIAEAMGLTHVACRRAEEVFREVPTVQQDAP